MSRLNEAVLRFALSDTGDQVAVLRRVGLETQTADMLLGHLAGHHNDKYRALIARLELADKYGW